MRHSHMILSVAAVLPAVWGCSTTPSVSDEQARREMLTLLMPGRIEIVKPFTRAKSFDDDTTPDGIELLLRAVNALDNPGLMIVGDIRAELYEYVPASGDNKGRQYDTWQIPLSTVQSQRTYWNQLTQMYEFKLQINPARVPKTGKYVLLVTYNSPLGEHLTDEIILGYRRTGSPIGEMSP